MSQSAPNQTEPYLGVRHSVLGRQWQYDGPSHPLYQDLISAGYPSLIAQLLAVRGVDVDGADLFLNPTLKSLLPDPSSLVDMDKAAKHIVDAVQAGQTITVFADYDVDGGSSAAQLIRWGRAMGAEFGLYVPDRVKEGFGPSASAFKKIKDDGADLVITVDCGAAAERALQAAKDIGLPVIVIDHHLMHGDMPPSLALINPNRPDDESGLGHLAAAGVTFMTLVALNREASLRGLETPDLKSWLGLAALGTVCDVVPLTGLNRAVVRQGLKVLENAPMPGVAALMEVSGTKPPLSTYHLGFQLGPRINAGGRIGQADMGAQLLASDDSALVRQYAERLNLVNAQRRAIQDECLLEATEQVERNQNRDAVICVSGENWHPGIIGVVAGRLKDKYERPAIVIATDGAGLGKGSGRSMAGVNLGAAIEQARQDGLLIAGGGHEMAAGLTITQDNIETFRAFLNSRLGEFVSQARENPTQTIDATLSAGAVSEDLMLQIDKIAPFGSGNPEPVFAFTDMRITYAQTLNGGHVRFTFEDRAGARINGIAFGARDNGLADILLAPEPGRVHALGRLKLDTWNGRKKMDLHLIDLAHAD